MNKTKITRFIIALTALLPQCAMCQKQEEVLAESHPTRVEAPTSITIDDTNYAWIDDIHTASLSSEDKTKLKKRDMTGFVRLVQEKEQTVLHCFLNVERKREVRGLAVCGGDTYIVDLDTGTRYRTRGAYTPKINNRNIAFKIDNPTIIDIQVYFPPLPPTVKNVKIYGILGWYASGIKLTLNRQNTGGKHGYDKAPTMHTPRLETPANNYNRNDATTYSCYTDAHLVAPMPQYTMAMWRTPKTTYLAIAYEQNWQREYWSFNEGTVLVDDNTGKKYRLRKVQGLPMNETFFIRGLAGDMVAFVLEFDPLPLTTTSVSYHETDSKPFSVWGSNWYGHHISNIPVDMLIDNQKKMEYHKRVIVE